MTHPILRSVARRTWAAGLAALLVVGSAACASNDPDEGATDSDATTPSSVVDLSASGSGATVKPSSAPSDAASEDEAATTSAAPSTTSDAVSSPGTTVIGDDEADTGDVTGGVDVPVPGPTVVVEIDEPADFGTGVVASIDEIRAVEVEGRVPGERSGPGVLLRVRVENQSADPVPLDFTIVDLIGSDGASAIPIEMAESDRLAGELAPGASAVGLYHYYIPVEQRAAATITISYAAGIPTALFTGALPDA